MHACRYEDICGKILFLHLTAGLIDVFVAFNLISRTNWMKNQIKMHFNILQDSISSLNANDPQI